MAKLFKSPQLSKNITIMSSLTHVCVVAIISEFAMLIEAHVINEENYAVIVRNEVWIAIYEH